MTSHRLRQAGDEEPFLRGLRAPTQDLLVQMLLYKTTFTGGQFMSLADRQDARLRELLLEIAGETQRECEALAEVMRDWDAHRAALEGAAPAAAELRSRLLLSLLMLKEDMVETGLSAAMRAPTPELRERFVALVDIDRHHADRLREALGARTARERTSLLDEGRGPEAHTRAPLTSLSGTLARAVEGVATRGGRVTRITLSAAAARHLRDEGAIGPEGKAFGLPIDIDMAWDGEAFALESDDRISYAELLSAARAGDE